MKKIFFSIMVCLMISSAQAMMDDSDTSNGISSEMVDVEIGGYQSCDDEGDGELMPERVTYLVYNKKDIQDKYERKHLLLMIQELYERDRPRYTELISEVVPVRGHRPRPRSREIDRLYSGLMQLKQSISTTNDLLQQQIDGDNEQARIDTYRWRCDYCRECCFGVLGLVVGILGTSVVASIIK